MRIWAIVSRKGGAGKTTVAVNLAIAGREAGLRTMVADIDPLRSASDALRSRLDGSGLLIETAAAKLFAVVNAGRRTGCELLVIDTPAAPESDMVAAMNAADLSVIVSRPTYLDIAAGLKTVEAVRRLGRSGTMVLNQCPPTRLGTESSSVARTLIALEQAGIIVCPQALRARTAFQISMASGYGVTESDPRGRAAAEIRLLFNYLVDKSAAATLPVRRAAND